MNLKLSDKASAQLSNIMYLLGKHNANFVVAQMINVFEKDLATPKPKQYQLRLRTRPPGRRYNKIHNTIS